MVDGEEGDSGGGTEEGGEERGKRVGWGLRGERVEGVDD